MEKKSLIRYLIILLVIFLWLLVIGQANGISNFAGDINLIDEGQYAAWLGHMLHGKIMYKDINIQYGPLLIFLIFILTKIFGTTFFIIRFVSNTVMTFLGILVAIFLLRSLKVSKFFELLVIIFIVIIPGIGFQGWIGVANILLAVRIARHESKIYSLLLGFFLAISALFRIDVVIFSLMTIGIYIFVRLIVEKNVLSIIKDVLWIALGLVLGISPFIIVAIHSGFLSNYIYDTIGIVTSISGINSPNGQGLPPILFNHVSLFNPISVLKFLFSKNMLFYWSILIFMSFLSIILIRILQRINTYRDTIALLILVYCFLIFLSIVGRSGHYGFIVPFIFVIGSYLLTLLFEHKAEGKFLVYAKLIFFLFLIFYAARYIAIYRYNIFSSLNLRNTNEGVSRISPIFVSKSQADDIQKLQNFVNENSRTTDTVYILNNDPGLYFLLDRENPTEYDLPVLEGTIDNRYEIINALQKNPPRFIIQDLKAWPVDDVNDDKRQPEVFNYVYSAYKVYAKIGHYIIYKKHAA